MKSTEVTSQLTTTDKASEWATHYLGKNVTISNISYLIQYGRIKKYENNGRTLVNLSELKEYYQTQVHPKEKEWKQNLGNDLNWILSFDQYKESERTKHVHRLHPYKGKFIPQLVEYFIDDHVDEFKQDVFFRKGDIILDPFCGSGTTLVQANELGINGIGIDISAFNSFISNSKLLKYDLVELTRTLSSITVKLKEFQKEFSSIKFDQHILEELKKFNDKYFPSPDYRRWVRLKQIDEKVYGDEKERIFKDIYYQLLDKYQLTVKQDNGISFIDTWFLAPVRKEIDFVFEQVKQIQSVPIRKIAGIILSRTIRSCRATTHADLATLISPVTETYYCKKHGKICKPIFSILSWWQRYSNDTIKRLKEFDRLRTDAYQFCLTGDSRNIDILAQLKAKYKILANLVENKKIQGIFSSPPYVGLINYHEQHAYAYDLFGFERNDDSEIGNLYKGQGKDARNSYVEGVSQVLNNCKNYLVDDYNIFLVANDKWNLYPKIAEKSDMIIVNQYKRPVLNRVEKGQSAYSEIIFHLKSKN